jgi:hypothetical protein
MTPGRQLDTATGPGPGLPTSGRWSRTAQSFARRLLSRLIGRWWISRPEHVRKLSEAEAALRELRLEKNHLEHTFRTWVPPGHFYSPIPDVKDLRARESQIFSWDREVLDVDLDEAAQWRLLQQFAELYPSIPFTSDGGTHLRYCYENPGYSYADAIVLHCMIRLLRPRRIVEIGCGYSSAATLDTNEHFFDGSIDITFIEPFPDVLLSLLRDGDEEAVHLIRTPVQDVPSSVFEALEANDILFVDSTHVSKINSDVNHIFFEILPRLKAGVSIHFHDIFYPFEYPKDWVYEGRAWQEAYLLRAFLQNNDAFRLIYFQSLMMHRHHEFFAAKMPLCLKNAGGNIWIQKVAPPSGSPASSSPP